MNCRDLTLEYKYASGQTTVRTHRVWDADRFLQARVNEGRSAKKPEDRYEVKIVEPKK